MDTTENTGAVVGLLTAASLAGGASKYAIGPLVPVITTSFDVTAAALGLALSGMWFAFAVVQVLGGLLADMLGERHVLLLALSLVFVGSASLFAAPTYPLFFGALLVLGAGTGTLLVSSTTYIGKTTGTMGGKLGVITMGSSAAGLLAPLVAVSLGAQYGWRVVMLGGAALAAPIFVGIYTQVESIPGRGLADQRSDIRAGFERVLDRRVLVMVLFGALLYFAFQALASFFPTLLLETTDIAPGAGAVALSAFFALSALTNPLFGRLSESVGRTPVLSVCLVLSLTGFALLSRSAQPPLVAVGVVFVGIGFGWGPTLTAKLLELFVRDSRGTGYGIVNTLANLLGSAGSAVTGFVAVRYGWHQTTGLLAATLVCALGLLLVESHLSEVSRFVPSDRR